MTAQPGRRNPRNAGNMPHGQLYEVPKDTPVEKYLCRKLQKKFYLHRIGVLLVCGRGRLHKKGVAMEDSVMRTQMSVDCGYPYSAARRMRKALVRGAAIVSIAVICVPMSTMTYSAFPITESAVVRMQEKVPTCPPWLLWLCGR